jgi:hypothetical protein
MSRRFPLILFLGAFLLLGAAGTSGELLPLLGSGIALAGALIGYGRNAAKADTAKERAESAHRRISALDKEVARELKSVAREFSEFKVALASTGALRADDIARAEGRARQRGDDSSGDGGSDE